MKEKTQIIGKKGEYEAIGRMLELGLDVYGPLVDVENIDCVVRTPRGKYNEIQIKTRTRNERGEIFQVSSFKPRDNFFVILHIKDSNDFWVLPSMTFYKYRVRTKYLEDRGLMRLILNQKNKQELNAFYGAFYLLKK